MGFVENRIKVLDRKDRFFLFHVSLFTFLWPR